jgi:threonine synthase
MVVPPMSLAAAAVPTLSRGTFATGLRCTWCAASFPLVALASCPHCETRGELSALNETLLVEYDLAGLGQVLDRDELARRPAGLWAWHELLPVADPELRQSAGVGGPPLVRLPALRARAGLGDLWAKTEGANPTGSFKDRPVGVATARAVELGARELAVFTSGNVGAALAAVCARLGLPCHVFLLAAAAHTQGGGPLSTDKLAQITAYGAEVLTADGALAALFDLGSRLEHELGWVLLNNFLPYMAEGDKTLAFEICAQLGWDAPDAVVVPLGTGTNLAGMAEGFRQLHALGFIQHVPRMIAAQPVGADSMTVAASSSASVVEPLAAVRPNAAPPLSHRVCSQSAYQAVLASGGAAVSVSDAEILAARAELATCEGILAEAASAAGWAAAKRAAAHGLLDRDSRVAVVLTSHGLKDLTATGVPPVPPTMPVAWPDFIAAYAALEKST